MPLVLALAFVGPPVQAAEPRLALLVANATSRDGGLPRLPAPQDVEELARELKHDGFAVAVAWDAGPAAMRAALDKLLAGVGPGAIVLLYFNGIALQQGDQTRLIPAEVDSAAPDAVARDGVALDSLLGAVRDRGAEADIVILDAARRAAPGASGKRAFALGPANRFRPQTAITVPNLPDRTLVLSASTGIGPGDAGQDGLFMRELIRALRTPGVDAEEAFGSVRSAVALTSKTRLPVWIASSLHRPFFFSPAPTIPSERSGKLSGSTPRPTRAPPDFTTPPPPLSRAGPSSRDVAPARPELAAGFPWPPPAPSTSYPIPDVYLGAGPTTMGRVARTIATALETTGYVERRFYPLPVGGVALVTRLERTTDDGSPGAPRWLTSDQNQPGLFQLLRGLFVTEPGHYRVIVFLVANRLPEPVSNDVSIATAKAWLRSGFDDVPSEVADLAYAHGQTIAYIYDFVSDGRNFTLDHDPLPAKDQLVRAGLLAVLETGRQRP